MTTKIKPIYTARDAALAKAKFDVWGALHEKACAEHKRVMDILSNHPEIGVLCRNGDPVYYVNHPEYIEAKDPAEVLRKVNDWEVEADRNHYYSTHTAAGLEF